MPSVPLHALIWRSVLALAAAFAATVVHAAQVDDALADAAAHGRSVDALIVLNARAPKELLRSDGDYRERRRALVGMLRATAEASQSGVRRWLDDQGVAYRPFWITNAIQARLTPAQLQALAARPEIAAIASNAPLASRLPLPRASQPAPQPNAVEWGVDRIKAPQLWALGITGAGVVVAGQDTGIRWTHGALKARYRGWDAVSQSADHNYNWHDAIHVANDTCAASSPQPCDDDSHGTHTLGSMVGSDGGNRIGVAPDAKWIGCRNMNHTSGTPASYNECAQWLLAPTDLAGLNADPDRAPDVIGNSWGCAPSEGCTAAGGAEVRAAIENLVSGGILFVAAAGNSGPSCSSIAFAPGTFDVAFTVGATTVSDAMWTSSSRGPVALAPGTGGGIKPDVVAPGENVRSATRFSDTSYAAMNGTSMAAPHVVGAAALLMQVNPALKGDPAAVAELLRSTAVPLADSQVCGGIAASTLPNPVQGYGQIDLVAAFAKAEKIFADGVEP